MLNFSRKQDELYLRKVKDLLKLPANKKCFDCSTKSPFYVNMTIHAFICMRCSGLIRGMGHRIKSISASKFTGPEVAMLQFFGNETAQKIWLSNYGADTTPEPETDDEVRSFMLQKYNENKWLDSDLLQMHEISAQKVVKEQFLEDGTPLSRSRRATVSNEVQQPLLLKHERSQSLERPKSTVIGSYQQFVPLSPIETDEIKSKNSSCLPEGNVSLEIQPSLVLPKSSLSSGILSELAGLEFHPTYRPATYTGGILTPTYSPVTTPTSPTFGFQSESSPFVIPKNDPYAALRSLSLSTETSTLYQTCSEPRVLQSNDKLTWIDSEEWVEAEPFDPVPEIFDVKANVFIELDPFVQFRHNKSRC